MSEYDVDRDLTEKLEAVDALNVKATAVAKLLLDAGGAAFAFTGAGISTSCGIPDFRGPKGVWTLKAKGLRPVGGTPIEAAVPSAAHMILAEMTKSSILDCVVSQNVDGLHARSGVPLDKLFELHGNSYKLCCWDCDNMIMLDAPRDPLRSDRRGGACRTCIKHVPYFCHCVKDACTKCGAAHMVDSIIHFKEDLRDREIRGGFLAAKTAKLCIVLGSSLTVSPANEIPAKVASRGGKVVIVNKQDTPLDDIAAVRVYGDIDDFLARVWDAYVKISAPDPEA